MTETADKPLRCRLGFHDWEEMSMETATQIKDRHWKVLDWDNCPNVCVRCEAVLCPEALNWITGTPFPPTFLEVFPTLDAMVLHLNFKVDRRARREDERRAIANRVAGASDE